MLAAVRTHHAGVGRHHRCCLRRKNDVHVQDIDRCSRDPMTDYSRNEVAVDAGAASLFGHVSKSI